MKRFLKGLAVAAGAAALHAATESVSTGGAAFLPGWLHLVLSGVAVAGAWFTKPPAKE